MDLLSLIVPIKTDVMKVSPWGMFGFMGTKSLMGNIKGGDPATWAPPGRPVSHSRQRLHV